MSGRQLTTPELARIVIALHFYGERAKLAIGTLDGEECHQLARELARGFCFVVDGQDDADWLDRIMMAANEWDAESK